MNKLNKFKQKFFSDKNGNIVLWQAPNIPLWGWFVLMVLSKVLSHGTLKNIAGDLGFGFLIIWSALEVVSGVNYFRKILGAIVLVLSLWSKF
jgi:hypothetical protein